MLKLEMDTFDKEVLEGKGLILVDFWSNKCEICKELLPHIEELSKKYGDKIKFTKLDVVGAMTIARKQKVFGVPTIYIYKDGVKIAEAAKEDATKENVEKIIKEVL